MSNLLTQQICVTGTIGCGKSRVARFLAEYCQVPYVDVDDIARQVMAPDRPGLQALKRYNADFISADGTLNRSLLRAEIFNSPEVKADVDQLLHPIIQATLVEHLQGLGSHAVVEIPLLYETGWDALFKVILVVYAQRETCLQRIMARDLVSRDDAEKAYSNQIDMELKKKMTPFIINNDGQWPSTVNNIIEIVSRLPMV